MEYQYFLILKKDNLFQATQRVENKNEDRDRKIER